MSAAKVCIPQILPSKFKPKLLPPTGESQERTEANGPQKTPSCEGSHRVTNGCVEDDEEELEKEEAAGTCSASKMNRLSESVEDLRNDPSTAANRRSAAEFSALYRNMHQIQRPCSLGSSPHGSVRSLTSLFEKVSTTAGGGRGEGEMGEGGIVSRNAVSYRVPR